MKLTPTCSRFALILAGLFLVQASQIRAEGEPPSLKREEGWVLASIKKAGKGVPIVERGRTRLVVTDERVTGSGGVNSFFGSCEIAEEGKIKFGKFGSTLRAGPDNLMKQEAAVIAILGKVSSYSIDGEKLTLSDESGENCLEYIPRKKL